LLNYGDTDLSRQYPYNYSFTQGIHNLASGLFGAELSTNAVAIIALALSCSAIGVIIYESRNSQVNINAGFILPLIFLIPGLSFAYYSVILIPLLAPGVDFMKSVIPKSIGGEVTKICYTFCLLSTLLPIYLGNDLLGIATNSLNSVQLLIPAFWVICYTVLIFSFILNKFHVNKSRD